MAMDASYQAMITGGMPTTPSSHNNLLPVTGSTHRITVTLKTGDDDNDYNFCDGPIKAHINLQTGLVDDTEPDVHSLCPDRSDNQRDSIKTLQQHTNTSNRMICNFCKETGHPADQYMLGIKERLHNSMPNMVTNQ